ncbi:MAG: DUF4625 domain-containing protein [Candidatus Cyclobacteriaceae bacterium M3_2C_046]
MKSINLLKKLFLFVLSVSAMLFLTNCDEDDDPIDLTAPTIQNVTLNEQTENIQVNPGDDIHFDAELADDQLLGQLKIDIHDNFDGHQHGRVAATPFSLERIIDLIGRTQTIHEDVEVPADAATGPYHFNIQFFDAAGNEGELMTIEFEIVDEAEQPTITITTPDPDTETEVAPGGSFAITGAVSDPDGLEELHMMLMHEEEDDHSHGRISEEVLWEKEWLLEGALEASFDEQVTIPANAETGHYILRIKAEDVAGNVKILKAEVHIE